MDKREIMIGFLTANFMCDTFVSTLKEKGPEALVSLVESIRDAEANKSWSGCPQAIHDELMEYLTDQFDSPTPRKRNEGARA